MRKILFVVFFFISFKSLGQCDFSTSAFQPDEYISYTVYYNWSFIWLNAGEVFFRVSEINKNNQPFYHLYSYGSSHKSYDWIYKVRDTYQAHVDRETLKPDWFCRDTYEGGYETYNQYQFNYKKNVIYSETNNSKKEKELDTLEMKPCTFDVLSIIYYARNQNYDQYEVGTKIPITVIIDGEIYELYIRYLGKEVIKTRDKKEYRCIKFSPLLVEGTIFKGGEDMVVWVTDDKNRVPVLVEAKILVGSIKAYLNETANLKYPVKALVSDNQ